MLDLQSLVFPLHFTQRLQLYDHRLVQLNAFGHDQSLAGQLRHRDNMTGGM